MNPEVAQAFGGKEDFGITERGMALQSQNSEKMLALEREKSKEQDLLMKDLDQARKAFEQLPFLNRDVESFKAAEQKKREMLTNYMESIQGDFLSNRAGVTAAVEQYTTELLQSDEYFRGQGNAVKMQAAIQDIQAGRIMKQVDVELPSGEKIKMDWFDAVALHGQGKLKDIYNNGSFEIMSDEKFIEIVKKETDANPENWDGPQLDKVGFEAVFRALNPKAEEWYVQQRTDAYMKEYYNPDNRFDHVNNPYHLGENMEAKRLQFQRSVYDTKEPKRKYSSPLENLFNYNLESDTPIPGEGIDPAAIKTATGLGNSKIAVRGTWGVKNVLPNHQPASAFVYLNAGDGMKYIPLNRTKGQGHWAMTTPEFNQKLNEESTNFVDGLGSNIFQLRPTNTPVYNENGIEINLNPGGNRSSIDWKIPDDFWASGKGEFVEIIPSDNGFTSQNIIPVKLNVQGKTKAIELASKGLLGMRVPLSFGAGAASGTDEVETKAIVLLSSGTVESLRLQGVYTSTDGYANGENAGNRTLPGVGGGPEVGQ